MAVGSSRIRLDLNSPEFQDVFFRLELAELKQVVGSLRRKWEALRHIRTPNGAMAYSLRLSEKIRGIAYRDGAFLRFISLHPDHDSAYER